MQSRMALPLMGSGPPPGAIVTMSFARLITTSRMTSSSRNRLLATNTAARKLARRLTASLHFSLGLAHLELKQFKDAADQMRQCIAKRDKSALAPINKEIRKAGPRHCLALCLSQMGEIDSANKEFQSAIQMDPQARPARCDYAQFLAANDRQVEALNLLFTLANERPGESQVWLQGGRLALSRPEFLEVALDWTAEAEHQLPQDPAVVQQRAEALLLAGQCEEALPFWRRLPLNSNPVIAAALVICETTLGENHFSPMAAAEVATSREFVIWYQQLLQFNARATMEALNASIETLERILPSAAGILAGALAEVAAA